jgi:hypothetical protein
MTSETLRAVSGIATRFDEHSKLLTSASDILGAAQTNLATTLGDRQNALEDLAVGLVRKSEEIERLMRSFEGILEGSLERAELRARESSDTIRSSMVDIVEAATQRFADATVEIRRTAEQIRGELDETRSALKKGVIDMPAEAKESTTAIRRAVAEQINALKELSAIVAKSGRGDDPRATLAAAPVATREGNLPRINLRNHTDDEAGELLLRGSLGGEAATRQDWDPDRREVARREPVSTRASDIGSLTAEIARAIDEDAYEDMLDRRADGLRDVFSRNLYTSRGQATFDKIQRKYKLDADFHAAVDRYLDDFERRLGNASRDSNTVRRALAADTGRIYVVLAHASGRSR